MNVDRWFKDNGDNTHRLNYDLNKNSIVFDIGGYKGWFTEQINHKYGSKIFCFEPLPEYAINIQIKFENLNNITVFTKAVSVNNNKGIIYFNNDSSSSNIKSRTPIEVECVTLDKIFNDYNITYVDLIKINIEGDEYQLLDYMISNDIVKMCGNIQVQFHDFIENYEYLYEEIKNELSKTHDLTYCYPFVWENWKIKTHN